MSLFHFRQAGLMLTPMNRLSLELPKKGPSMRANACILLSAISWVFASKSQVLARTSHAHLFGLSSRFNATVVAFGHRGKSLTHSLNTQPILRLRLRRLLLSFGLRAYPLV